MIVSRHAAGLLRVRVYGINPLTACPSMYYFFHLSALIGS